MKSTRHFILFGGFFFLAGVIVCSIFWMAGSQAQTISKKSEPVLQGSSTNRTQEPDEFRELSDDRYITKFNGTKLKLNYGSWASLVDIPSFIQSAKVLPLKTAGVLVGLEDTLYRLNQAHEVVWKYREGQSIDDYTIVESTGLIYGTAGDNVMFILDASTGRKLHRDSRNGSAAYGVAENYGSDMCLVTDSFEIYREKARSVAPMNDGITCWRGEKALWHQDFPPDAQLVISGDKILAVTKTKTGIYLNEIHPPKDAK